MRSRRGGIGVVLVVLAFGAILLLSRPRQDPYLRPRLDLRGTGPQGLAASVALLRGYGSQVVLGGLPDEDDDLVVMPADTLSGAPSRRVARWVHAGGTLVVTDPTSSLSTRMTSLVFGPDAGETADACALDATDGLVLGVRLPPVLVPGPADTSCFATADGARAGLVVRRSGAGLVASLSTLSPFLNQSLDAGDDAALLVALVDPHPGQRVRMLDPTRFLSGPDVGDGTALGAIGPRGRQAVLELVVAFLAWGCFRGRRLGRPVPEELPVPVPSSDLVLAVGELLGRGEDLDAVAGRLRRRARRELGIALGLGADPDPATLVDSLTPHVTVDPDGLRHALFEPVSNLTSLLDVCHQLDRLQEELHATHAAQ